MTRLAEGSDAQTSAIPVNCDPCPGKTTGVFVSERPDPPIGRFRHRRRGEGYTLDPTSPPVSYGRRVTASLTDVSKGTVANANGRGRDLLADKNLLITGVLSPESIAFSVARIAQEQGADVVLTGFGRGLSITERTARRLPTALPVLEMDATDQQQVESVAEELGRRTGCLDGV